MASGADGTDPSLDRPREVLIVDDREDTAVLLEHYLEAEGHATRVVASGEEALQGTAKRAPDLVLLDVMLPGIDGFEVCRRIKRHSETALTPVVLVTALDRREDRIAGLEAGADEFLSKPVNREELLARVRSLLRLQATRETLERARLDREAAKRERLRATFERYVSPKLADTILDAPDDSDGLPRDATRRIEATVLFADMRGFTALVERFRPETVVALLNEHFTCLTGIAFRYDGTVFNMAGDSLLVGFGVPLAQPDAVARALCTARDMQRAFARLAESWREKYGASAGLGIGISHGDVIAGNVGSPDYMSFTLIGDTVNTAERITHLAHSGEIKVSNAVRARAMPLADAVGFEEDPSAVLRGKLDVQSIYGVRYREDTALDDAIEPRENGKEGVTRAGQG